MMNLNESQTNVRQHPGASINKEKQVFSLFKHSETPQDQLNIHYTDNIHQRNHCLEDNGIGKVLTEIEPNLSSATAVSGSPALSKTILTESGLLNYFSLPKYGMSESSTQTDLTSHSISELIFIKEEYLKSREEYLKRHFNSLKLSLKDSEFTKGNFIGIKRKGEALVKASKPVRYGPRKPRIKAKETTPKPVNVSNVTETNNYIMFNEFLIDKKAPKILFDEGFNVADMINDIKMNKISMFTESKRKKVRLLLT
jgi:hypothetical protein